LPVRAGVEGDQSDREGDDGMQNGIVLLETMKPPRTSQL
jgi:hypothetical protein